MGGGTLLGRKVKGCMCVRMRTAWAASQLPLRETYCLVSVWDVRILQDVKINWL